jgi:hypothetical protein
MLVRTEQLRHGRRPWLAEIPLLAITLGPWFIMIWLLWPRR